MSNQSGHRSTQGRYRRHAFSPAVSLVVIGGRWRAGVTRSAWTVRWCASVAARTRLLSSGWH